MIQSSLSNLLVDRISTGLKRRTIVTPSQWALKYRMMGSPYPGPWGFKYHPWLREMHDSTADYNVGQKAAQMGFTETVLNIVFFYMDIEQVDCLYILPNQNPDASDFSAARFDPAIELSTHLKKLFRNVQNVGHKRAGNTNLYVRGSKSRSGLKSVPVGVIIFDEKDEMVQENIPLAKERQSGYNIHKTWEISTPTIDDFGINNTYKRSTQEHFAFKCPGCSKHIILKWPDNFELCGEHEDDPDVEKSYIKCDKCLKKLDHEEKHLFLQTGTWEASNIKSSFRGFHVNQMYSSSPSVSPPELAKAYHRGTVNPSDEQEFFNSKLGLPHIVDGARISDNDINACRGSYSSFSSYDDSRIVTMGIDVGNWLHYEIDEWHPEKDVCKVLKAGKCRDFSELEALFRDFKVDSAVIDSQPERRKATEFAEAFYGYIRLCSYVRGIQGKQINVGSEDDYNELRVQVDRTSWLDKSLGRFKTKHILLPMDISLEYKTHIKSLVRIYEKDADGNPIGKYVQVNDKASGGFAGDHFAHSRNYSEIARNIYAGNFAQDIGLPV